MKKTVLWTMAFLLAFTLVTAKVIGADEKPHDEGSSTEARESKSEGSGSTTDSKNYQEKQNSTGHSSGTGEAMMEEGSGTMSGKTDKAKNDGKEENHGAPTSDSPAHKMREGS